MKLKDPKWTKRSRRKKQDLKITPKGMATQDKDPQKNFKGEKITKNKDHGKEGKQKEEQDIFIRERCRIIDKKSIKSTEPQIQTINLENIGPPTELQRRTRKGEKLGKKY